MKYLKNIRTGAWGARNWKDGDGHVLDFAMHATSPQMGFLRELAKQHGLGQEPSAHYGVKIPYPHPVAAEAAQQLLDITMHSSHHFAEQLPHNKKAAGLISSIGKWVTKGAKTVGEWGKTGLKYLAKNSDSILKGISTGAQVASAAAQIAGISGAMNPDTASSLEDISQIVAAHSDHFRKKPEEEHHESPKKLGSGILMYL